MADPPSSSSDGSVTDGEEYDPMLLSHPGIKRPPYKASVAQAIKDTWEPDRSGRRNGPVILITRSWAFFQVVFVVILLLVVATMGYTAGYLVRKSLDKNSKGGISECSKASFSEGTKKPPSLSSIEMVSLQQQVDHVMLNEEKYNWGDEVAVNGSSTKVAELFKSMLDEKTIRDYLEKLTEFPHIAGSDTNRDLAMDIYKEWLNYSFDSVEVVNYTVLLSYPDQDNPNSLKLKDSGGAVLYDSKIAEEPPLTEDEKKPNVAAPFNAYSGHGSVSGPLVYVNYGRIEDFMYLTNGTFLKLDLTKYICIARYGEIFRGDKAHLAQSYGCKGLLIYSDPQDYAPEGTQVYPDGPGLPQYGIQRGSLLISDGDPLTPGIPAIPGMYRRPYSDVENEKSVPTIPVQPVSYGDIVNFMKEITEHECPKSWVGGLKISYSIAQPDDNMNVAELIVNVKQSQKAIHNVVATLYGRVEPDRAVVLGNHRDAWVFGAVDPNSGTAVLRDIAKGIGKLRTDYDWRPGRTMVLCSWDAEEYGLIGSTEYVEDLKKMMENNAVAYLDVDVAVSGSLYASASANPLLYEPVWQAAKAVASPDEEGSTLYDDWLKESSKAYANGVKKPKIGDLGSGSDFTAFLQLCGISCASLSYSNGTAYAVYHSVHDNFYWMTHFGDPDFSHHKAMGLLWVNIALSLLTAPMFPGKAEDFGFIVEEIFENLNEEYGSVLNQNNVSLDYLSQDVVNFNQACKHFDGERKNLSSNVSNLSQQLHLLRIVNDKIMDVERAFINAEGLPGRPYYRHVIFAPSSVNSYGSSLFPGIADSIFDAINSGGDATSWDVVKRQIDIVRTHLRYATLILQQPTLQYAPMM